MTDSAALRKLIADKGLKLGKVAEQVGLSAYGFALKIDNVNDFRTTEVSKLCEILGITSLREKERIFFAKKCD